MTVRMYIDPDFDLEMRLLQGYRAVEVFEGHGTRPGSRTPWLLVFDVCGCACRLGEMESVLERALVLCTQCERPAKGGDDPRRPLPCRAASVLHRSRRRSIAAAQSSSERRQSRAQGGGSGSPLCASRPRRGEFDEAQELRRSQPTHNRRARARAPRRGIHVRRLRRSCSPAISRRPSESCAEAIRSSSSSESGRSSRPSRRCSPGCSASRSGSTRPSRYAIDQCTSRLCVRTWLRRCIWRSAAGQGRWRHGARPLRPSSLRARRSSSQTGTDWLDLHADALTDLADVFRAAREAAGCQGAHGACHRSLRAKGQHRCRPENARRARSA